MKNLGQMLKQAQEVQVKMQEMQDALADMEVTGTSGAGMCLVTMNGKGEARQVKIDRALVKPDDAEVLEDLILAAINDAKEKAEGTEAHRPEEDNREAGDEGSFEEISTRIKTNLQILQKNEKN